MTAPQQDQAPSGGDQRFASTLPGRNDVDQAAQPDGQQAEAPKSDDTDWKAEARKWEQRAKDNSKAARELEQQRQAAMTESERAVADAEKRGRTAAATEFGKRLARTEFDAAAARRNPGYDTAGALEFIDLARFVGDDGEPDTKAITAAVERLIPTVDTTTSTVPSFDGGARQTAAKPQSMSDIIRGARRGG